MTDPWQAVDDLLADMIAQQEAKVLALARTLMPGLTPEDLRNPHDFPPLLTSATFNYEDGILAGLRSARVAVRTQPGSPSAERRAATPMENRLVFLIGSPRSGTTLLARMLGSHSAIYNRAEPHLLTPLAHLGYYGSVQKASYDPFNVAEAIRGIVDDLPRQEADYLDACRAYADVIYARLLAPSGRRFFLDKTPAYALVLRFVTKLYPRARYVVLTRHPVAVFVSYVSSFFDGSYELAQTHNPILDRYVPAIAQLLRERPVPVVHVRYEELVSAPEQALRHVCAFLELPFEPGMIEYGKHEHATTGLGDPLGVGRHDRPVTTSVEKWADEIAGDGPRIAFIRSIVQRLDREDVRLWGYDREQMLTDLDAAAAKPAVRRRRLPLGRYRLQRKVLVALRRNIHHNALGRVLKRLRFALDVVLRD